MRVLITGGLGFVGRHLSQYLVSCGDDVALTYKPGDSQTSVGLKMAPGQDKGVSIPTSAQTLALDIRNKQSVEQLIALLKPDAIYHLAGITFIPDAEQHVDELFAVNVKGTQNILEAVVKHSPKTRVLYVGSSQVYGEPRPGSLPVTEAAELRPVSVYGVSKATADLMTFTFAFREGVHAVRIRPFTHTGPGQSDVFALSSFAKQVAQIKLGKAEPQIKVGNLEVKRDYSDVSDIVRGYHEALLNGKKGEVYNLCSGRSVQIGEVLKTLLKVAEVEAEIVVDPDRVRAGDVSDMYGSYQRAQKDFGWKPRIDLEGTLHSLFAYWIEELSKK